MICSAPSRFAAITPHRPTRAVTDDRGNLAGADVLSYGRVMAGPHHVREREQRRHQRLVFAGRQNDERPVRLRHAHCFGLCARDVDRPEEPAMDARRLQALSAEDAGAV
jgi:hypothetical protein